MLRPHSLVLGSVALASSACTALLGTFEVGGESGASLDAAANTEAAPPPAGDGGAGDAALDAETQEPLVPLGCVEIATARQKLASYPKNQFTLVGPDRIYVSAFPSPSASSGVVIARDAQNVVHALVFPIAPSGSVRDVTIPAVLTGNNAQVLSAKRSGDALTLLVLQFVSVDGGTSQQAITAYRLEDGAAAWAGPTIVTQPGELTPPGFCLLRANGSFEVKDTAARDVVGVVNYTQGKPGTTSSLCQPPYSQKVAAFGTRGGAALSLQQWNVPADAIVVDLPYDSVAVGASNVFSMVNPVGDGGTTPGSTALLYRSSSLGTYEAQMKVALSDPQDFFLASAFGGVGPQGAPIDSLAMFGIVGHGPVLDGGTVAFVGGTIGVEALGTFTLGSLTKTPIGSLAELPSDRAGMRIETFGNRAEMLAIGRAADGRGFNAYWFDHLGRVRWRASPAVPSGVLFAPTGPKARSASAEMTFVAAPTQASAELLVGWMDDLGPNDPAMPVEVWATKLACTK